MNSANLNLVGKLWWWGKFYEEIQYFWNLTFLKILHTSDPWNTFASGGMKAGPFPNVYLCIPLTYYVVSPISLPLMKGIKRKWENERKENIVMRNWEKQTRSEPRQMRRNPRLRRAGHASVQLRRHPTSPGQTCHPPGSGGPCHPHPHLHLRPWWLMRHPPSLLLPPSPSLSTPGLPCGLATSCCYFR